MTLRIPTKSDVKDKAYLIAINHENARGNINIRRISSVDLNNAINSHYHGETIDSKEVLNLYLEKINFLKKAIHNSGKYGFSQGKLLKEKITFESFMHPDNTKDVLQVPIRRYKISSNKDFVKVKERSYIRQKFGASRYRVEFSPEDLFYSELESLTHDLQKRHHGRDSLTDLLEMEKVLEDFENNNANTALLKSKTLVKEFPSTFSIEDDPKSEAYKIKQEHEKIAKGSNVYLQFWENFWVGKKEGGDGSRTEHNIPIHGNFPEKGTQKDWKKFLNSQKGLKKLIRHEIKKSGTVIFNGEIFDSWEELVNNY